MGPVEPCRPCQRPGPWPPGAANSRLPQPLGLHLGSSMRPHCQGHPTTHPASDAKIHEQNGRPGKGRHGTEDVCPQAAPHLDEGETGGGGEQGEEMRRRREGRRQQLSRSQASRTPPSHSQGAVAPMTGVLVDPSPFLLCYPWPSSAVSCPQPGLPPRRPRNASEASTAIWT